MKRKFIIFLTSTVFSITTLFSMAFNVNAQTLGEFNQIITYGTSQVISTFTAEYTGNYYFYSSGCGNIKSNLFISGNYFDNVLSRPAWANIGVSGMYSHEKMLELIEGEEYTVRVGNSNNITSDENGNTSWNATIKIYPYGDANSDCQINVRDSSYIARLLAEGKNNSLPKWADYNNDGKTNVRDASLIARYLANKNV